MMDSNQLLDLRDCTEFRQRLEAKTPPAVRIIMATLLLLVGAATTWAIAAKASLVVVAHGRIRPTESPNHIYTAVSPYIEGRVIEVLAKEGDQVSKGDLLLRLDTSMIDNEISKRTYAIEAGQAELEKLRQVVTLLDERTRVAKEQASAELNLLLAEHERAVSRRESEIRRAAAALDKSQDHARRTRQLFVKKVETESSWIEAQTQLSQDEEAVIQAKLPLDDSVIAVRRQAIELVDRDHHLRRAELAARIVSREGEIKAEEIELATRQYERHHADLRAPIDGVVISGNVKIGDILKSGQPVLEIAQEDSLRFEAQVSTEDVGDLREGMPVNIKLDAYDFQKFGTLGGSVSYISPDSQLADLTTGGKAFYQVKIDLKETHLSSGDLLGQVKLGMVGVAEIVTARESLLAILAGQIRKTIRVE